jgi:hypothetical protein
MKRLSIAVAASLLAAHVFTPAPATAAEEEVLMLSLSASGEHHWSCVRTGAGFDWKLSSVDVTLFDELGRRLARERGGNRWVTHDGVRLHGELMPTSSLPERNDLPWMRLRADGPRGSATRVAQLFRLPTASLRPATPCSSAQLGQESHASWKGEYYFFAST